MLSEEIPFVLKQHASLNLTPGSVCRPTFFGFPAPPASRLTAKGQKFSASELRAGSCLLLGEGRAARSGTIFQRNHEHLCRVMFVSFPEHPLHSHNARMRAPQQRKLIWMSFSVNQNNGVKAIAKCF